MYKMNPVNKSNNAIPFPITISAVALNWVRKFVPSESMQQYFTFESTVCFSDTRLVCFPVCLHKAQRYFHISIYPTAKSRYTSAIDCSRKQNIFVFLRPTAVEDACPSCFMRIAFAELDISTYP